MEEHSPSSATSGDNFETFMADPLQIPRPPASITSPLRDISSPSFKDASFLANGGKAKSPLSTPVSPSSVTRSASVTPKPSFISNFGQPWGLFHAEEGNGATEAVRHPLMGNHPLSDEDEEDGVSEASPSKLPTASAASTTQTFSNSPEAVTSATRPVLSPSPLSYGSRSFQGSSELPSLRKLAVQPLISRLRLYVFLPCLSAFFYNNSTHMQLVL